jgi:2-isopropylmalate synthase
MNRVVIFDTTLRDGEQAPGFSMNRHDKLAIASQLARLNVDVIEAGFPASSEEDFAAVRDVALKIGTREDAPVICALSRVALIDVDRAWEAVREAGRPRIHVFVATSDIHLRYKLRKTRSEVLQAAVAAIRHARAYCADVEFSAEDASRTDLGYLCEIFEAAVDGGAGTLNVPDTVGYAMPAEWAERVATIRDRVRNMGSAVLSVHCHNDLGHAVANSLAAVRVGARQIECTINGIGERAGNAALEEIVMALRTRRDHFGVETAIRTEHLYRTSRLLSQITEIAVQPNKAVVGDNAFAHEAGIHQDGMLKHKSTYEIMDPADIGRPPSALVIGKHSGRHAVGERLRELGFDLDDMGVLAAFKKVKVLADATKRLDDHDLIAIGREVQASAMTV